MNAGPGIERRMVLRIIKHWDALRQDRLYPTPQELDPAVPPLSEFWHDCFMIVVAADASHSTFEYVGRTVLELSQLPSDWHNQTPCSLQACPQNTLLGRAVSYAGEVLEKSVPISRGDSFADGEILVKYRSILLPMSSDGRAVDRLFGAVNCLRVGADQTAPVQQS